MWIECGAAMANRVRSPDSDDGLARYLRTEYGATSLRQLTDPRHVRRNPRRGAIALLAQILGVARRD